MRLDVTPIALAWDALRHWRSHTTTQEGPPREEPVIGLTDRGEPLYWPTPSVEHAGSVLVLGASGTGKSALIGNAIAQEIGRGRSTLPSDQQPAAFVISPKSDFRVILEHATAAESPDSLESMVILNPFSREGFPFNLNRLALAGTPLEVRAWQLAGMVGEISTAMGMLRSGSAGPGARQLDVLSHLLLAALAVDDLRANVLLAYDALITPQGFERLAAVTNSERARGFLTSTRLGEELSASCSSRLRLAFAATESIERMVGSPGCVQFDELMAPGRLCLIDLGEPFGLPALQTFWASLLAALGIDHALSRPAPFTEGHHLRIVVDELQIVAPVLAPRAESLLTTGRARNVSTCTISQGTALIERASDTLIPTLMTNCPTKLVGRLSASDADLLSRELTTVPGNPERPKLMRERVAASISNLPDRTFLCIEPSRRRRFHSLPIDMEHWEQAAQEHRDAISAAERRFALPAGTPRRATLSDLTPQFNGRRAGTRDSDPEPRSPWG